MTDPEPRNKPEEYDLYIADDGMIYRHFAGTGESMDISQDEGDLMEIFKALSVEVSQLRAAVAAERERCAKIVEDHRHPKVRPCNGIFCDELLAAAIRAEPEEEDAER